MIQRYSTYEDGMSCKSDIGEFVKYEDHQRIVNSLELALEEARNQRNAAYHKGYRDGYFGRKVE